jgi:hypothetical protein
MTKRRGFGILWVVLLAADILGFGLETRSDCGLDAQSVDKLVHNSCVSRLCHNPRHTWRNCAAGPVSLTHCFVKSPRDGIRRLSATESANTSVRLSKFYSTVWKQVPRSALWFRFISGSHLASQHTSRILASKKLTISIC